MIALRRMPTIHQFRVSRLCQLFFILLFTVMLISISKRIIFQSSEIEQKSNSTSIERNPTSEEPVALKWQNSSKINGIRIHYYNIQHWSRKDVFDKCHYNCTLTWGHDYKDAKYVIFFAPRLPGKYFAPFKPVGQTWIYYSKEAPINYGQIHSSFRYKFNWTMTMRRDADSVTWNGFFKRKKNIATTEVDWETKWKIKRKNVSWFVSECKTQSKREMFVKKLSKLIDTGIYGGCGKNTCPRSKEDVCFEMLKKDFKFYLSFENAICRDYITEKSYNIYHRLLDVIPVVRGYSSSHYKKYLPPDSYINTDDFDTVQNLTNYLKKVSSNSDLFRSYMKWSEFYEGYFSFPVEFCNLCERAHKSSSHKRLYVDVNDWDRGGDYQDMCTPPRDVRDSASQSPFSSNLFSVCIFLSLLKHRIFH